MLYPQIPKSILKKVAAELDINIGIFKLSFKDKADPRTNYEKLNLVTKFLEDNLDVGTVDGPKAYFKGILPMRWGKYGAFNDDDKNLVWFGGETSNTIIALVGSTRHLTGAQLNTQTTSGDRISYHYGDLVRHGMQSFENESNASVEVGNQIRTDPVIFDLVEHLIKKMEGPPQRMEFIAKTLWKKESNAGSEPKTHSIVIGTPLYVSLLE